MTGKEAQKILTADFDYELPAEFIAQQPVEPRDSARLLLLDRNTGKTQHTIFNQIRTYFHPGDLLVVNETRVIPARLYARKIPSGGRVEVFLLRRRSLDVWEVIVGGKGLVAGRRLQIEDGPTAEIIDVLDSGRRLVRFSAPIEATIMTAGHVPLPPYIHTRLANPERYQTVYARQPGSVAAPTAGLHFTPGLMAALQSDGINFAKVTLHIGLDTFAPVTEKSPYEHRIHTEWCQVTSETAEAVNRTKVTGHRVVAVGTTSVRTLESAARGVAPGDGIAAFEGSTDLFILPGYRFTVVDALITNFHLPRSTLIMLVSAFAGREQILHAYEIAKQAKYRFYSFGDAMLII